MKGVITSFGEVKLRWTKNSIIEIGSKANVILRFKAKTCINGKTYDANEPYLYLKDVNVLINYTNFDKTGSSIKKYYSKLRH